MGENLQIEGRRSVRTPMQWTSSPNGGFSTADPDKLRRPLTDQPGYGPADVNVTDQRNNRESLLNWFEHIIRQRRETPEIGWGDWQILDTQAEGLVALRSDWEGRTLVTLHNLSSEPVKAELSFSDVEHTGVRDLLDGRAFDASDDGPRLWSCPPSGIAGCGCARRISGWADSGHQRPARSVLAQGVGVGAQRAQHKPHGR